ncbi:TIGR04282 family arsenosugar biosynthesis glycosyltransferase [Ancylothrix sp. C2]|uniref:TIGR04282 family arsenosugar biosynthesis glycosyltransferase n=1 Tax=Ancylothrix sp. D3o TaxID=2953691 RepID=UPI0021BAD9B1|nr:TIGR04282 family arsenosugar biosynthesis glycosyltransferase [Ancylothrix sp. D3o]MCT7952049.1 TIGR04282 family arsenosugar biosynthesis glycosyltransferase [Ancylothrix sp. D3o]
MADKFNKIPEKLIIFTRYPEPGKTKTRLIPALGVEGAAKLHRHLIQHTLNQVENLIKNRAVEVEVKYAGGSQELMQKLIPPPINCTPQSQGDLGEKMKNALAENFAQQKQRLLIIGTDCPGLDNHRLKQAFDRLYNYDLVLGPALDGGYYLIGMRRMIPELFAKIDWGTEIVMQQTLAIAQHLNLTYSLLDTLADIDRPEDLTLFNIEAKLSPNFP